MGVVQTIRSASLTITRLSNSADI